MNIFSSETETDILNPADDPAVIAAQEALNTATASMTAAEIPERASWVADSIGGTHPPPDSEYWPRRAAANAARAAVAQAVDRLTQARHAARSRGQLELNAQVDALLRQRAEAVMPAALADAERCESLQRLADRYGLRFPASELLTGPIAWTMEGLREWAARWTNQQLLR